MLIVSNTSPLLNLAIIRQLDLLPIQFTQVVIPTAVRRELYIDQNLPGSPELRLALNQGWLRAEELQGDRVLRALVHELDEGEAAAIALALELNVSHILIDESDGRSRARALGLQPIGVLGVLLRAKRAGQVPSLRNLMDQLRNQAGFFINPQLYDELVAAARE